MKSSAVVALGLLLVAPLAHAAPGDVFRVTPDKANLRAGPSSDADVRDTIAGGTQVIELRRDGDWYGIRVLGSGQEGWIYGRLLDRVQESSLEGARAGNGFSDIDKDFQQLVGQIGSRLGIDVVQGVLTDGETLNVTPTTTWLRASGQDAQVFAVAAIYEMWRAHHGGPVKVVMSNEAGKDYITLDGTGKGAPRLTVNERASGTEG